MKVAIVGGGAAGFFAAINVKENFPDAAVCILEKSNKLLSKVKISGGGRCNVTNACSSITTFAKAYPRGEKQLKKAFKTFNNQDLINWFKRKKIELKTESDNRMFPVSDRSQTIIDCFINSCKELNIEVLLNHPVITIKKTDQHFELHCKTEVIFFDKVIIASGGAPKLSSYKWLQDCGHPIIEPVPSLFTFNMPSEKIRSLMGVVVPNCIVKIQSTKLFAQGPVLITHWGMSGPAILKLSAFGARLLHEKNYNFSIQINWIGIKDNNTVFNEIQEFALSNSKKKLSNTKIFDLPSRMWHFILSKCGIDPDKQWQDTGSRSFHKLVAILTNDTYSIKGKTTFKEEFVSAGGVDMDFIEISSMQSKVLPGLYFAGEVLNIDGITGGYNFQAAWTTAYIAALLK